MERCHFQLASGYVNIDGAGLIFNRSGNWHQAQRVAERGQGSSVKRIVHLCIGVLLILLGAVFLFASKGSDISSPVLAFGLFMIGGFKMYDLLRNDLAAEFRVPFSKITDLKASEGALHIDFLDFRSVPRHVSIAMPDHVCSFALDKFHASRS